MLQKNEALDFDDLIMQTIHLFERVPETLEYYQNRFQYIHVDEYQDTNHAQYYLVKLLANKYKNICVVGDSDQSIDRKSTRLNSSHVAISYAVFCLKKKNKR